MLILGGSYVRHAVSTGPQRRKLVSPPGDGRHELRRGSRGKGKGGMYLRWAIRPRNQMIYRWLISSQPSASTRVTTSTQTAIA